MSSAQKLRKARIRRHHRVRKNVRGTAERPRLAVFRSNRHITAQVIDDNTGKTLAAASSTEVDLRSGAKAAGVSKVVFDRGGFQYHGRVAAVADAARKNGLEF